VSFRDAVVIATSNAGADMIRHHVELGESLKNIEKKLVEHLIAEREFKQEFLNRFDDIVLFEPLGQNDLLKIIDLIISSTNKTLSAQKLKIEVDDTAKSVLLERGYDPQFGARPMRRTVQKTIESLLAKRVLAGETKPGQKIVISADDIL
tara:strand:- start:164 stop:613 length:450 start_codon:yes stop_codon:yes gene_type:complete